MNAQLEAKAHMLDSEKNRESKEIENRKSSRILIFVVAYQHERLIEGLFERVPEQLFNNDRIQFLVIDDAGGDATAEVLQRWIEARDIHNVSVARNPVNQRYGGNQKLGYRYALEAGFDFTILLHGDAQYAPEMLPDFIDIWERTGAAVVLGTRMGSVASARAGGMPLYKVVANTGLTMFQNYLTGLNLTEYHTGYRAYSSAFLRRVPFEINTNEYHFDTEMLLQAANISAHIEEFDIPTHYGDEDCNVDGVQYGKDVLQETVRYRMHRMGMLCSLKYRDLEKGSGHYEVYGMDTAHTSALAVIEREQPGRIVDLGCGSGIVARACREKGIEVTGVDLVEPEAGALDRFEKADLSQPLPIDALDTDMVLMLDVIEELSSPEQLLLDLRNQSRALRPGKTSPLVVVTTPNVAFISNRVGLLFGRFNYTDRGILDIQHRRLFNRISLLRTLGDCGYAIEKVTPVGVPWEAVIGGSLGRFLQGVTGAMARIWPSAFAFQFMVTCRPMPGVEQILSTREQLGPNAEIVPLPENELEH
ncbi:MAG: glycosyltransferase involved in cell wall biosynthesis [Myxococcota bacterium]|jgi:glycosyltransferase involved in cell wall biosynthesis